MTSSIVYATAFDDSSDCSDVSEGSEALAPESQFSASTGAQTGSGRLNKSQALASILEAIGATAEPPLRSRLSGYARRLRKCASWNGKRCEQPFCPRCQKRVAVRNRRKLEARLRAMGPARHRRLRLLRLSVVAGEPRHGVGVLGAAFATLRRCRAWRSAVIGGESHIGIKDAATSDVWNVHLHALIELAVMALLPKALLASAWQKILHVRGVAGSADLRPASRPLGACRHMEPFNPLAYYTTRRQRGFELLGLDPSRIVAIVDAYPRLRLKCTFGTWRQRKRTNVAGQNEIDVAIGSRSVRRSDRDPQAW